MNNSERLPDQNLIECFERAGENHDFCGFTTEICVKHIGLSSLKTSQNTSKVFESLRIDPKNRLYNREWAPCSSNDDKVVDPYSATSVWGET